MVLVNIKANTTRVSGIIGISVNVIDKIVLKGVQRYICHANNVRFI